MFHFFNARLLRLLSLKSASLEAYLAGQPRVAEVAKQSIEAAL
jgi:hypothetical protein